jgi:hypothetical protein
VPRHEPAQLEHRQEVGADAELEREPDRPAVVALHGDRLAQRALALGAPLDPDPEALGRQPLAALEVQVRVRQLVHRTGSRSFGGREEARELSAHGQLEGA